MSNSKSNPSILALGTALPKYIYNQKAVAERLVDFLELGEELGDKLRKVFAGTRIKQRYSVVPDLLGEEAELFHQGIVPGMSPRNEIFKREAPLLAHRAAEIALEEWGGPRESITHLISATCTGMIAPGLEFLLMESLGLRRDLVRLGVNFMGCFGAFSGLETANALAQQDPSHRVLLVCTELCSLHFQSTPTVETFVGNALFADGSAAAVVGQSDQGLWQIVGRHALALPDTREEMTWEASDRGYLMRLTAEVPRAIHGAVEKFCRDLLGDVPFDQCDWPVHPGGKAILIAIQQACGLVRSQLESAWEVFRECGNMSSSTFLFVLDRLRRKPTLQKWAVGVGFGPGLSMEGILLKR